MAKRPLPTPDELRQLIRYEPETGKLFWLRREGHTPQHRSWNTRFADEEITNGRNGYIIVKIQGRRYMGHRVAWCLARGRWPYQQIDHKNGVRDDNRIENLRDVSPTENRINAKRPSTNTSGHTGVRWHKKTGKWAAAVQINGRQISLGLYEDKEEAAAVAAKKRSELGFSPRHGTPGIDYGDRKVRSG